MKQETLQVFGNRIARKNGCGKANKITFANVSRPKVENDTWHYVNASGDVLRSRFHGLHFCPKWSRGVSYVPAFCEVILPNYYRKFWD